MTMDAYKYIAALESVRDFVELGGPVLTVIGAVSFFMWLLIFERLMYLRFGHAQARDQALLAWRSRPERSSWRAHRVREMLISLVSTKLENRVPLIRSCIAICPLLGLLGTVTGMIHVFETMAFSGSGNSRSMASGVAMATIPTMAGMVAALSGYAVSDWLGVRVSDERKLLADSMVRDMERNGGTA